MVDELDLLRQLMNADSAPVADLTLRGAIKERLRTEPDEVPPLRTEPAPRLHQAARRRQQRRWVLAGSVVGVAAAAVVAVTVSLPSSPTASATPALPTPLAITAGSHASAVAVLDAAAKKVSATSTSAGSVTYAATQNYSLQVTVSGKKSTTLVATTVRDVWESPNGAALVREYRQETYPAGGDAGGPKPVGNVDHNGRYAPGQWADTNIGLPDTPVAMRSKLLTSVVDYKDFPDYITLGDQIGNALGVGTATPAQTAAMYEVLAALPQTYSAGTVVDSTGRSGVAVAVPATTPGETPAAVYVFVIDPNTGRFLEYENISKQPPSALRLPAGPTVQQYNTVLNAGKTTKPGQKPDGASKS